MNAPSRLSIIIPVLDEAQGIVAALEDLAPYHQYGAEIIVVDGGSTDGTVAAAMPLVDRVLMAPCGRASQMNAGAAVAIGETLLFLHADTRLPGNAYRLIAQTIDAKEAWRRWGRFDVRIEGNSAWLPVVACMMNWRSRLTGVATGDQAIFISRDAFTAVGGFPVIPLMEDIEISRRLRRISWPVCLAARVTTSGRRWERRGVWRTIVLMWYLRLRYWLGADPRRLAMEYGYVPNEP